MKVMKKWKEKIKGEIVSKRTRNIKEFLNTDNSVTAAIYPYAVHYLKDGKLVDIDNSLVESTDSQGEKISKIKSNSFKAEFSNKSKDNKLISLSSDKISLSWSLQGANKVDKENIELKAAKEDADDQEEMFVKNIATGLRYKDILKDVDVEYIVESESIKENIVLKSTQAIQNKYVFNLDIGNFEAKLNEDKSISIYNDKDESVSKIESPFMYDSKLEFSDKIYVKLNKVKSVYTLELIPDKTWLNSSERVFPVTIDPTVMTSLYYQEIQDTFIYSGDGGKQTKTIHSKGYKD
ncbi:MAG: hypothetical protein N2749_00270 [Clostridia bacterium]|nr:hypothetical protein [Clostridia bacterium]